MNNTILILIAVAALWLLTRRKKPARASAIAAYQGAYTGSSAAGLSTLAGWGALAGGLVQGLSTNSASRNQPYAAAGLSGSSTVGLGDAPLVSDEDLLGLLG